jgi:uncharacterized protein (DUF1810 family)
MNKDAIPECEAATDPFQLSRFLKAQNKIYPVALHELRTGKKRSHWMWFIFPQFAGLGNSEMSQFFAIHSLPEAREYLAHPILGHRLGECAQVLLSLPGSDPRDIFDFPDDLKLQACMTLFAHIAPDGMPFQLVLDRFFGYQPHERTMTIMGATHV